MGRTFQGNGKQARKWRKGKRIRRRRTLREEDEDESGGGGGGETARARVRIRAQARQGKALSSHMMGPSSFICK